MSGGPAVKTVAPGEERPHRPTDDPTWIEAYLFDLVHGSGDLGVSIELLSWPQAGRVAFHVSVVERTERLISLVDPDVPAPRPPSLELRAPGLWADVGIQTPREHVTVDLEAFAVALDDPNEVFAGAYGHRTALGSELEWETAAEPVVTRPLTAASGAYEIPCIVHGELLLADRTIEIDGWGWRSHRWGSPAAADRAATRGRTAEGEWLLTDTSAETPAGSVHDEALEVIGHAPVPDPSFSRPLRQRLVRSVDGTLAWLRHLDR